MNDTLYAIAYDGHVYKNCAASVSNTWIDIGLVSPNTQANYGLQYDPAGPAVFCGSSDGQVYRQAVPSLVSINPPTAARGQTLDVTLTATGADFTAASRPVFTGDGVVVNSTTRLGANRLRANISVKPETYLGPRSVWVKTGGDKTNKLVDGFTVTEAERPSSTWYLAEGTNAWGFSTYISVANPNDTAVTARMTYMDPNPGSGSGVVGTRDIELPPLSQTTVSSEPDIGAVDFSTKVECLQGRSIAVDRTMFWTGRGAPCPGYHNSIGTEAASRTWYLPEGSSNWGFETWTLVVNPGDSEANLTLTYMTEGLGPRAVKKTVPARSRATYSMAADIGEADASIMVESDRPVVAERSMYRDNRREGSCSVGATSPAGNCFLAEGATGYDAGFVTYVLVQNPSGADNEVKLTFQTPSGEVEGPSFTMPPGSRRTVRLNDLLPPNTDVSTRVHGSGALVAERAVYWDNGTGEAFHASIGLSLPHMAFTLPDGQADRGSETWTLVQNPNPGAVRVRVSYLPQGGGKTVAFTDEIPPGARRTYNMADRTSGRASVFVESLDGARPVMVERAMYMNNRGGGTGTVGCFSQ